LLIAQRRPKPADFQIACSYKFQRGKLSATHQFQRDSIARFLWPT
jgi:hypothetical protein